MPRARKRKKVRFSDDGSDMSSVWESENDDDDIFAVKTQKDQKKQKDAEKQTAKTTEHDKKSPDKTKNKKEADKQENDTATVAVAHKLEASSIQKDIHVKEEPETPPDKTHMKDKGASSEQVSD